MSTTALRRTLLLFVLIGLLGACREIPIPTNNPAPTPSPTVSRAPSSPAPGIVSATVAAATVLSADPRFVGFMPLNPVLAQERWYEMTANESSWDVTLTVGWGDCSAGCAHQHAWHYRVDSAGIATFLDESGEGLPAEAFPSPASGVAEINLITTIPCPTTASCPASGVPGARFEFTKFGSKGVSFRIDTGSNGVARSSLPGGTYILTAISRPDGGPLPEPFALSLAPGQKNSLTIAFTAPTDTPAATPNPSASPAP